jgi:hypothetical protein
LGEKLLFPAPAHSDFFGLPPTAIPPPTKKEVLSAFHRDPNVLGGFELADAMTAAVDPDTAGSVPHPSSSHFLLMSHFILREVVSPVRRCGVSGAAPGERTIDEGDDVIAKLCPARVCVDELQKLNSDAQAGQGQFYRDSLPVPPTAFYIDTYRGVSETDPDPSPIPSFVRFLSQ